MNILPIQNFCADLFEQVGPSVVGGLEIDLLRQAGAVYRADTCFAVIADLADALAAHERGRVNETAVRFEALKVARLACLLWLSTLVTEDGDGR